MLANERLMWGLCGWMLRSHHPRCTVEDIYICAEKHEEQKTKTILLPTLLVHAQRECLNSRSVEKIQVSLKSNKNNGSFT
jgi:hypothetical protein